MLKKKNAPASMDTVIGEYTTIIGNVDSEGSLKILGKVEGDIKAGGDIYIESTSSITGNIYGSNVYVSGKIKGNIIAKGILHLQAQARLYGDIEVTSIVTDEGAIFQGNCKMIDLPEEEAAATSTGKTRSRLKIKREEPADESAE
ncbi:MAG TPA: polymer-forming cytoskeletal protein [Thermoclostridium caenicola]|uniref:Protein CcmA, bactofilin family n=1 Tax=Thermoclostridium caenicola TaxID=659425 RepID=A0A1M6IVM0_9FIRM|nr:polymer-forming cytoskeletal protein [Thermoclostridium caenicola]SHJ38482.1 protein CcmA, bactofilin family [Thermoclostridium caenicola]HOK42188.1 polymer-forming cytoskeletal protein [Thermoclostridium caenicola]HOL85150.1 polymer-forming cytoskeletal protein [Thermoclostridium caenicola]HPO76768.1 polymer-forming cytoskeletal protein [Thermoclostridium caenicola]HPU22238.1 polymer-forming cytoskeletal protein [Thermoclostridium caenicola]